MEVTQEPEGFIYPFAESSIVLGGSVFSSKLIPRCHNSFSFSPSKANDYASSKTTSCHSKDAQTQDFVLCCYLHLFGLLPKNMKCTETQSCIEGNLVSSFIPEELCGRLVINCTAKYRLIFGGDREFISPPYSSCINADVRSLPDYLALPDMPRSARLVCLDPPWRNRSVQRLSQCKQ
eukprot:GCRY01003273.1.p1 GENE.GCRY01003273.1~~GCRY01003273.1.p1  ORF type:complete len:178 (-),score=4.97 GCRY01003273.1:343-876(-)